jgi:hypothetical protein
MKRLPFFAKLPKTVLAKISRISRKTRPKTPQWRVVSAAVKALK